MHMFYVYDFMCWAWTLTQIIDEMFVLSATYEVHEYLMFCVEREALEHMIYETFVLSMKL